MFDATFNNASVNRYATSSIVAGAAVPVVSIAFGAPARMSPSWTRGLLRIAPFGFSAVAIGRLSCTAISLTGMLFNRVRSRPSLRYENQLAVAEGDYVMLYGRFSGINDDAMVTVNVVRVRDGLLAEHWDIWEKESTRDESLSGLPMFGDSFPDAR